MGNRKNQARTQEGYQILVNVRKQIMRKIQLNCKRECTVAVAFLSAPASSSIRKQTMRPLLAAYISAVQPPSCKRVCQMGRHAAANHTRHGTQTRISNRIVETHTSQMRPHANDICTSHTNSHQDRHSNVVTRSSRRNTSTQSNATPSCKSRQNIVEANRAYIENNKTLIKL